MPTANDRPTWFRNAEYGDVERRVRLMAVLGILLTSFLIGGIATVMLYRSHAQTLTNQLFFAVQLQTAAIEAELARLNNIATQITSRTRIRQELERYNRGEINKQALLDFTIPKLTDAMRSSSDVLGITRLSAKLEPILAVGEPIDAKLWPQTPALRQTSLGEPADGRIVVSAPIYNRSNQTVGIDLVMFSDERLRGIMQDFFGHIETAGSIQIGVLELGQARHFYDIGHSHQPLDHEALKSEIIEEVQLGTQEGLHPPDSEHGGIVVVHQPVGENGWVFMFYADPSEFFGPARMHAAYAALTVLALALLGIMLTSRVIHPLVAKLSTETRSLQRLLQRNEELLDTVQANEAKLQSVIDNAPAVIFIKDRSGRYLLVNSSYEQLVSLPREQIVGKFDYELFPEDIAKSTRDTDLEVIATGKSISLDEKAPHADGMHDYLSTKFPMRDGKGEIYGVCGISTDITERKQVERRLALTQTTVDKAGAAVLWADPNGRIIYLNETALEALRIKPDETRQRHLSEISTTYEPDQWKRHWGSIKNQQGIHFEAELRRSDGSRYPAEIYANHLAFSDQEFYIALFQDISARRESERRLRQSATVFDCTAEAIVITDTQGTVLDVNAAFSEILGYPRDEVIGSKPSLWKSGVHDDAFYRNMWRSIRKTGEWRGEIINRSRDGAITTALATISTVRNEDDGAMSYVAVYTDISQIKESQQQLRHLAHHDALTNLPNRVLFNERLQHCLDRAARRNARVAVIFVDLDNFKHVNDSLGHTHGDRLLVEVATLLTSLVRNDDTVARIGGDEFTILIEEASEKNALISIIEKIIEGFDREFILGESNIRVTPSIGVSISPDDGLDADTLMRNADAAMYRAKAIGKNTYQFYTEELTKLAFERMHMDNALRNAIAQGEFSLFYQPQIDLVDGRVIGMEALVRWRNPELGMVPPDQFIPIAEDNGLILPLGEWILEQACRQARAWLDGGLLRGNLAVNISGVQVRRGDLAGVVRRVLGKTGMPAERLELEVTESFIMGESHQAIMVLHELRSLGVTLAVDDFGTGYSSLSYLKSLPVHLLKIDKSFIRDIPEDPNDMAITRAVIALARSLNLDLVAEGVETEVQRRFLLDEGCQFGQGYLFHRPLSSTEMERLLSDEETARPLH